MTDRSNGYEAIAADFLARRGRGGSSGIGVNEVRRWAQTLPRGVAVLDLGCGPGFPITEVLVSEGLCVFGVDAAPSFVQAFRSNLPNTPVVCEAVQDSRFFDRTFDGVLAWGLIFLLSPEDQHRLIQRIADILVPGGRLLFTTPAKPTVWNDAMTGLESRSLGAEEYRRQLPAVGISLNGEYEDEGQNHYFDAFSQSPHALMAERDAAKGTGEIVMTNSTTAGARVHMTAEYLSKDEPLALLPLHCVKSSRNHHRCRRR